MKITSLNLDFKENRMTVWADACTARDVDYLINVLEIGRDALDELAKLQPKAPVLVLKDEEIA